MGLEVLREKISQQNIVICGAGPSLNDYIPMQHVIHIALNRAFLREDILFDYMLCLDFTSIHDQRVMDRLRENKKLIKLWGVLPKKCESSIPDRILALPSSMQFAIANQINEQWDETFRFAESINAPMYYYQSVASVAFQIVGLLNPCTIYLVGMDFSNKGHFTSFGESFTDRNEHLRLVEELWEQQRVIRLWESLKKWLNVISPKTKVVSINPYALKNIFEDYYI